jgi:hypothetical protein
MRTHDTVRRIEGIKLRLAAASPLFALDEPEAVPRARSHGLL